MKQINLFRLLAVFPVIIIIIILFNPKLVSALNQNHQCDNCHQLHGATGGEPLLPEINAENTCLACHSPGGPSSAKASNHLGYTCMDCHDPHSNVPNWLGGTNIKMILADVEGSDGTVRPVVFESRGTTAGEPSLHSFCDNDEDANSIYDNICDTCHMSTRQHIGYPIPAKHRHKTGATCTTCHPHSTGFDRN